MAGWAAFLGLLVRRFFLNTPNNLGKSQRRPDPSEFWPPCGRPGNWFFRTEIWMRGWRVVRLRGPFWALWCPDSFVSHPTLWETFGGDPIQANFDPVGLGQTFGHRAPN